MLRGAMASPLISLFKEQVENESKKLAATNNLEKRGDFFARFSFFANGLRRTLVLA